MLIAEYGGRVTERNLKGEILWEKKLDGAMQRQRLANSNTLILNPNMLREFDAAGKERILAERERRAARCWRRESYPTVSTLLLTLTASASAAMPRARN